MAIDAGLALSPPMGFNTWNRFAGNINQQLIEETMDAMLDTGLADLGYRYLNIDDGWMAPARDAAGRLVPDPERFPGGIARLAERAHKAGLKLGIYSCCGTQTCMRLPASYGYEETDAKTFAEWNIDFLKQDWCHVPYAEFPGKTHREVAQILYGRISDAIKSTGRPMILSMCNWGDGEPWLWARSLAHLWRTTPDIADIFAGEGPHGMWNMVRVFQYNVHLAEYAGPGGWNDPDMLEVGNGGMSTTEYQSHFALWCMMASPLLIGTDLRTMSDDTRSILMNRELIAIDQDPLGQQARLVNEHDGLYTLVKPLSDGNAAVAVFNATDTPRETTLNWPAYLGHDRPERKDLWTGRVDSTASPSTVLVPPGATLVWRLQ